MTKPFPGTFGSYEKVRLLFLCPETRKQHSGRYRVFGGQLGLMTVFALGIGIIIIQFAIVAGGLPNAGCVRCVFRLSESSPSWECLK